MSVEPVAATITIQSGDNRLLYDALLEYRRDPAAALLRLGRIYQQHPELVEQTLTGTVTT
jgi:hypothetical protein